MARRKTQTFGVRDLCGSRRRLTARQTRQILRTPGRAFVPDLPLPRIKSCDTSFSEEAGVAFERLDPGIVSQLLAGPHSGPGRSPGAARVLHCE